MKKILLIVAAFAFASPVMSQTFTDNGSISYKMEMSDADNPQIQEMFKDAKMEIGFLNGRYRMDMAMPMTSTRSYTVGDSALTLIDMMGNKMMMMVSKDQLNSRKLDETTYDITPTKETKKIAGYNATKYTVKTKDNQTFTVYATDKLPSVLAEYSPYTKIPGAPLEYEMSQGPYKMKITATDVKTGSETEEKYQYSTEGYKRMSLEQMKGMMGGQQKSGGHDHGHDHSDPNHKH